MISTAKEVDDLIDSGAPMLIAISGGKDSRLVAEQTVAYARDRNHSGRIILVYADLGRVVWSDALQQWSTFSTKIEC